MSEFCEQCQAESTDESAGDQKEGMFGREFMGAARHCPDCGSHVATLWQVFMYFPVNPVGSYRYKAGKIGLGEWQFFSRKVPLDVAQVRSTRISGSLVAIIALAIAAVLLYWTYG
jgi:hypothetical protein